MWLSLYLLSHKMAAVEANRIKLTEARPTLSVTEFQRSLRISGSLRFDGIWFMGGDVCYLCGS